MELHSRARERLAIFRGRKRVARVIGGTAIGWVLLASIANLLNFKWLALGSIAVSALGLAGFLLIVFWQKRRFESRGELEYTQRIIEEELRRRAQMRREANR